MSICEVTAPYSSVNFSTHAVLVAAPQFEKAPGPRPAFCVPRELLSDTTLGCPFPQGTSSDQGSNGPTTPLTKAASPSGVYGGGPPSSSGNLLNNPVDLQHLAAEPLRLALQYLEALAANGGKPSSFPTPLLGPLAPHLANWEHEFLYGSNPGILKGGNKEGANAIERHLLSEVMIVADYLGIVPLMDLCGAAFAAMLQGKSNQEIRDLWGMENDLTSDEQKKFKDENSWADEAI